MLGAMLPEGMRLLFFCLCLASVCAADTPKPCVFCEIVAGRREAAVVLRDERVIAFMDIAPHNPGHVLELRLQLAGDSLGGPAARAVVLWVAARRRAAASPKAGIRAEGFTFRMNAGAAAGQTVFHAHLHVVPRFAGDGGGDKHSAERPAAAELEAIAAKIRAQLE